MKILLHGNTSGDQVMEGTCRKCSCMVECAENETKLLDEMAAIADFSTPSRYVECPECGDPILWVRRRNKP